MRFLPWHMNFFCRYRPLPEELFGELSRRHPLLQSRLDMGPLASPLERLLADTRAETHQRLSEELMASLTGDEALERAERLAMSLRPEAVERILALDASEVAG
jgi:uncharacterized membrane protein YccC